MNELWQHISSLARRLRRRSGSSAPYTPKRAWWQRLIRGVVGLLIFLLAAYITLPWWLPTGYVRRYVARDLHRQTGLDVSIHELSVSWSRGIEIRRFMIHQPPEFGGGPLVFAERIHCDFSPVDLAWNDRIRWMTLEGLRVHVKFDEQGNVNLAPLRKLNPDIEVHRIHVVDGLTYVMVPGSPAGLRLMINDMEYLAGRDAQRGPGRITLSALLQQKPRGAPVRLHLNVGLSGRDVARLEFAKVDLEQIGLTNIIPAMPLSQLKGTAEGSLELSLKPQDAAGAFPFNVDVKIHNLEVQPKEGPRLPPVPLAGLKLRAVYGLSGLLDILEGEVTLPGVELAGQAQLAVGGQGSWQAIDSLHIRRGTIYPSQLSAFLTGRSEPAEGLTVTGPVALADVKIHHDGHLMHLSGTVDANRATVRRGRDVRLKPPGRALTLTWQGQLDHRTTELTVHRLDVRLGENLLTARGTIADSRRFVNEMTATSRPTTQAALERLLAANLRGTWQVRDVPALLDTLGPEAAEQFNVVMLDGVVSGTWSLRDGTGGLQISAVAPPETMLMVGRRLAKPGGQEMKLDVVATLDTSGPALRDLDTRLRVGKAQATLQDASIVPDADADAWTLNGRFALQDVRSLLAWVPDRPSWLRDLRGNISGNCRAHVNNDTGSITLQCKPMQLDLAVPDADGKTDFVRAVGTATLDVALAATEASVNVQLVADGSGLMLTTGGARPRTKQAGRPATLVLTGRVETLKDDARKLSLSPLQLRLGGSVFRLRGQGAVALTGPAGAGKWQPVGPQNWHGVLEATADEATLSAAPMVADLVRQYTVTGKLKATVDISGQGEKTALVATVDATDLSAQDPEKRWVKPLRTPVTGEVRARLTGPDVLQLDRLSAVVGDVKIRAAVTDASIRRLADRPTFQTGRTVVTIRAPHLATLDTFLPELKTHVLAGGADVKATWEPDNDVGLTDLTVTFAKAAARYRGKPVTVNGTVELTDVAWTKTKDVTVGKLQIERLDIGLGETDLHLVASLTNLPDRATGTFNVFANRLDAVALEKWLAGPKAATRPATQPTQLVKLTEAEQAVLLKQANDVIALIRTYAIGAKVTGRVDVTQLVYYDPFIDVIYRPRNFVARFSVDRGRTKLAYSTLLSGGVLTRTYDVHLADPSPMVDHTEELKNLMATPEIQPQLELFFPGNKINGTLSRTATLRTPLVDMIAQAKNLDYRPRMTGSGVTVTTQGVVEGRAAPMAVTRVFPGLNLTRYQYKKMTAFARFRADGTAENDMVFDGDTYDLYMVGTTDRDAVARYTVGLILLGTVQSAEENHRLRQGRLPLLKSESLIIRGRRLNEKITYPWPNETLSTVFLKNNIVYRLWLAKQQGKGTPDGDQGNRPAGQKDKKPAPGTHDAKP